MAQVVSDSSPYAVRLPRAYNQGGLGNGSFYNQKFKDMGRSSKETWIKKLWSQMFSQKGQRRPGDGKPGNYAQVRERHARSESRGSRNNDRSLNRKDSGTPRPGRRDRSRDVKAERSVDEDRRGRTVERFGRRGMQRERSFEVEDRQSRPVGRDKRGINREKSFDEEGRSSRTRNRSVDKDARHKVGAGRRDSSTEDQGRRLKEGSKRHPGGLKTSDPDKENRLLPPIHADSPVINQTQTSPKPSAARNTRVGLGPNYKKASKDDKDFEFVVAEQASFTPKPPESGEAKSAHPKNKQMARRNQDKDEDEPKRISLAVSSSSHPYSVRQSGTDRKMEREKATASPTRNKPQDPKRPNELRLDKSNTMPLNPSEKPTDSKREIKSTGNRYEKQLRKIHNAYDSTSALSAYKSQRQRNDRAFPHISSDTEISRPKRTAAMVEAEKKAKEIVEKAMKVC